MFSPAQIAQELKTQLVNGNRDHVAKVITSYQPAMAASIAFYLRDQLEGMDYMVGVAARLLEREAGKEIV